MQCQNALEQLNAARKLAQEIGCVRREPPVAEIDELNYNVIEWYPTGQPRLVNSVPDKSNPSCYVQLQFRLNGTPMFCQQMFNGLPNGFVLNIWVDGKTITSMHNCSKGVKNGEEMRWECAIQDNGLTRLRYYSQRNADNRLDGLCCEWDQYGQLKCVKVYYNGDIVCMEEYWPTGKIRKRVC
jgi:hypothetical protein